MVAQVQRVKVQEGRLGHSAHRTLRYLGKDGVAELVKQGGTQSSRPICKGAFDTSNDMCQGHTLSASMWSTTVDTLYSAMQNTKFCHSFNWPTVDTTYHP